MVVAGEFIRDLDIIFQEDKYKTTHRRREEAQAMVSWTAGVPLIVDQLHTQQNKNAPFNEEGALYRCNVYYLFIIYAS